MTERPILFSGPMVRAILEGRKTQTRRVMKPQPRGIWGSGVAIHGNVLGVRSDAFHVYANVDGDHRFLYCPYGLPGDQLWVRERARLVERRSDGSIKLLYEADGAISGWIPWPSRLKHVELGHCIPNGVFREGARIRLAITAERPERLQEIREADARTEGLLRATKDGNLWKFSDTENQPWMDWSKDPREAFQWLWDSLAKPGVDWAANPWVWAIEFRKVAP